MSQQLIIRNLTEELSANLVENGSFTNLDHWTVENQSENATATIAEGGGLRIFTSENGNHPLVSQPIEELQPGDMALVDYSIVDPQSGYLGATMGAGGAYYDLPADYATFVRVGVGGLRIATVYVPQEPIGQTYADLTIRNLSVRKLTPMPAFTASPNGVFELHYDLPTNPKPGMRFEFRYQIMSDSDYMVAAIIWNSTGNQYAIEHSAFVGGIRTRLDYASNRGNPTAFKVVVSGDQHQVFYGEDFSVAGKLATYSAFSQYADAQFIHRPEFKIKEFRGEW